MPFWPSNSAAVLQITSTQSSKQNQAKLQVKYRSAYIPSIFFCLYFSYQTPASRDYPQNNLPSLYAKI